MKPRAPFLVLGAPLLALGCARGTPIPGPLGALGRTGEVWPEAPVVEAPVVEAPQAPTPPPAAPRSTEPIPAAARHYLSHPPPARFRDDCSGFVAAVLDRAGIAVGGSTKDLWEAARADRRVHRRKTPKPGDLAFFDHTWDRNGNGKMDDPLTHVAVVIAVDDEGTIELAHAGTSAGRSLLRMNLHHPDEATRDGRPLNDPLRKRLPGDKPDSPTLSGQLWRGFARPPG